MYWYCSQLWNARSCSTFGGSCLLCSHRLEAKEMEWRRIYAATEENLEKMHDGFLRIVLPDSFTPEHGSSGHCKIVGIDSPYAVDDGYLLRRGRWTLNLQQPCWVVFMQLAAVSSWTRCNGTWLSDDALADEHVMDYIELYRNYCNYCAY